MDDELMAIPPLEFKPITIDLQPLPSIDLPLIDIPLVLIDVGLMVSFTFDLDTDLKFLSFDPPAGDV